MKRVLVIQRKHLLAAGILSLLQREFDLSVFDATFQDEVTLLELIHRYEPAVLVLDESTHSNAHFSFSALLDDCPRLRVIVIDEHENRMHIYEKQEVEIGRAADLVAAILRETQGVSK